MNESKECHTCKNKAADEAGYCNKCWKSIVIPAYNHVENLTPDDPARIMWFGYAVREAFIAGAKSAMDTFRNYRK